MKKRFKKIAIWLVSIALGLYLLICTLMYFFQESFLFHPEPVAKDFEYHFDGDWEEKFIEVETNVELHGIHFKVDQPKGIIFYLHGNAGNLTTWGDIAPTYTELGWDLFILDYRGFGKSDGEIESQDQFFNDVSIAYESITKGYQKIVSVGYSIGTGPSAMLASKYNPDLLVLKAPYSSLPDMMTEQYPFIPQFLLEYKFETTEFVGNTKCPIIIFHGEEDELIPITHSERIIKNFKPKDRLYRLPGIDHGGVGDSPEYKSTLQLELEKRF